MEVNYLEYKKHVHVVRLLPVPVLGAVIGTVYAARYGIKKMEDIAEELHMQ